MRNDVVRLLLEIGSTDVFDFCAVKLKGNGRTVWYNSATNASRVIELGDAIDQFLDIKFGLFFLCKSIVVNFYCICGFLRIVSGVIRELDGITLDFIEILEIFQNLLFTECHPARTACQQGQGHHAGQHEGQKLGETFHVVFLLF